MQVVVYFSFLVKAAAVTSNVSHSSEYIGSGAAAKKYSASHSLAPTTDCL